jgi:ketosteroid isomerase-like protein
MTILGVKHKRAFAITVLCLAGLPFGLLASESDSQLFLRLQQDWAEARKRADVAFLEKFYAAEFTVGNMNGHESTRAQDIGMFSSGDMKPTVITDEELQVHRYGNAAMVTGVEHVEGSYKGHNGRLDLRFSNFFVYRDDRWQLVRHQSTPVLKD